MLANDINSPDKILSNKLATQAAGKITELRKTIDTLMKSKDKDRKYFTMQTKAYQKEGKAMTKFIEQLNSVI